MTDREIIRVRPRKERIARIAVSILWIGGLALALRLGIGAVDPSQVLGLLLAVYLGVWGLVFFLRPNALTTNAARFVLVTMGIGLAIGLVELPALLGHLDYRDIFQTPTAPWRRHHHRPDRDLIYLREGDHREHRKFIGGELAGLSGTGPKIIYDADVRYDAEGFRNPSARADAEIVVVGDSFVEGLHVSDAELMTTQLSRKTGRTVANLGRSGDGPQQERSALERFGLAKHPKLCVWVFYEGNDLEDAAEYDAMRAAVANLGPISTSRILYERCFLRNALMFARRAWIAPEKTRPALRYQGRFPVRDGGEVTMTFASEDHHRGIEASKLEKAAKAIREADELCRRSGAKFLVVFVPTKFRIYGKLCRFTDNSPCRDWTPNDLPERLHQALGGIPYLDLTPRFRERAKGGDLLYLPDDTHWSAAGHEAAAQAIANEGR